MFIINLFILQQYFLNFHFNNQAWSMLHGCKNPFPESGIRHFTQENGIAINYDRFFIWMKLLEVTAGKFKVNDLQIRVKCTCIFENNI